MLCSSDTGAIHGFRFCYEAPLLAGVLPQALLTFCRHGIGRVHSSEFFNFPGHRTLVKIQRNKLQLGQRRKIVNILNFIIREVEVSKRFESSFSSAILFIKLSICWRSTFCSCISPWTRTRACSNSERKADTKDKLMNVSLQGSIYGSKSSIIW